MGISAQKLKNLIKDNIGLRRWMLVKQALTGFKLYNPEFIQTRSIFIHIPKTAGTSVGLALYNNGATGHYRWWEYRDCDPEKFNTYFKFAFVRHPTERFISSFNYLKSGGKNESDKEWGKKNLQEFDDINDFANALKSDPTFHKLVLSWGHFEPQHSFICDQDGRVMVDFLGRFEHIKEDFSYIATKLGRPAILAQHNQTQSKITANSPSRETIETIQSIYERDFDLFYAQ